MKIAEYHGTREIYRDMMPAAKSLLFNSDVDKIYFLIEDDEFPYGGCDRIEVINVSGFIEKTFGRKNPNAETKWKKMGVIRCGLTKLFPEAEKILSIDADTIVTSDVSELWEIDLDGYYFAGVTEPDYSEYIKRPYINHGVTVFNLKKLREDGKDDEIIEALNGKLWPCVSQGCINELCGDRVLELPNIYNVSDYTGPPPKEPKILHYAGRQDWRQKPVVNFYRIMPWGVAEKGAFPPLRNNS